MLTLESLQNSLSQLSSPDDLRRLFADLSYEVDFSPVFLRDETKSDRDAQESLAADPEILAQSGDFKIIYAPLIEWNKAYTAERLVISRLMSDYPRALWIFSDIEGINWHLINIKVAGKDVVRDGVVIKRRPILRRISLKRGRKSGRTICERLLRLDVAQIAPSLFGVSSLQIQAAHDAAFDVEGITASFFRGYRSVLGRLQNTLKTHFGDSQTAHEAALQTLNRLMFLRFLEHKETNGTYWLGDDPDFTLNLWRTYKATGQQNRFAADWLGPLFFQAFNNPFPNPVHFKSLPNEVRDAFIKAPYLNGGLFRENHLDAHNDKITDSFFESLFDRFGGQEPGFFERYNFTISEDTPFDQEVAVDPEMIGHVYESLINLSEIEGEETDEAVSDARGDHGIFYTQRIEIDLMGRLALCDYLYNHLSKTETRSDLRDLLLQLLFAYENAEKLAVDEQTAHAGLWEGINALLRRISICDPACGSGAFLVGMLSIVDDLQKRVNQQLGFAETPYDRAKRIIEESLYGVDVMPWAVHVAELRLWLQLVIENTLHPSELKGPFPLLPNLSFKIRHGDSLVQSIEGETFGSVDKLQFPSTLRGQLTLLKGKKRAFFNSSQGEKVTKEEIERDERRLFDDALVERRLRLNREISDLIKLQTDRDIFGNLQHGVKEQKEFETSLIQKSAEVEQVEKAREKLKTLTRPPFLWGLGFFEVFEGRGSKSERGFDIVIGNPPYVRQEKIAPPDKSERDYSASTWRRLKEVYKKELQDSIKEAWPIFFEGGKRKLDGKSDLYIYFFLHGLKLLNRDGAFAFITSNSWLDVGYGAELQEWLLRFGKVRLIFDNEVRRSFKSADVNTAITILGTGSDNEKENIKQLARFIMWRVPFESAANSLLWSEIEGATSRCIREEFRLRLFSGQQLWEDGAKPENHNIYDGNKWGGKFLRAPNIYDLVLEKGKDKFVRLGNVSNVRFGIKTGANEFFYLNAEKMERWQIEERFIKPVIKSPRECRGLVIKTQDLKSHLFVCGEDKKNLKGTNALKYIMWGEEQGFHNRPSTGNRGRWWDVGIRSAPEIIVPCGMNEMYRGFLNQPKVFADKRLYDVFPNRGIRPESIASGINSTLTTMFMDLGARTGLGEGLIDLTVYEVAACPILSPSFFDSFSLFDRPNKSIEEEVIQSDRQALDEITFHTLGMTKGEKEATYEAIIELVAKRLQKAGSLREEK